MKVPPKRKGNPTNQWSLLYPLEASMKVPPKRKGNAIHQRAQRLEQLTASMKVPPKRKGNKRVIKPIQEPRNSLNESPSEKEGK